MRLFGLMRDEMCVCEREWTRVDVRQGSDALKLLTDMHTFAHRRAKTRAIKKN